MYGKRLSRDALIQLFLCSLFVLHVVIRFSGSDMTDDAFIRFRYCINLAQGNGLVFNAGEHTEGYSNLLWILILYPFAKMGMDLAAVAGIGFDIPMRVAIYDHEALNKRYRFWGRLLMNFPENPQYVREGETVLVYGRRDLTEPENLEQTGFFPSETINLKGSVSPFDRGVMSDD